MAPLGARSATCSTARSSVTLIFSPANIASIRARSPDSSASCTSNPEAALLGQLTEQRERLVGDAVLRVVQIDPRRLGAHAPAAPGVVGEELPQVHRRIAL